MTHETFLVGNLNHPQLRLRQPASLTVEQEGGDWVVSLEPIETFGFGPHLTAAVEDWQQTVAELYLTLRAEQGRLGPAMVALWLALQEWVTERP